MNWVFAAVGKVNKPFAFVPLTSVHKPVWPAVRGDAIRFTVFFPQVEGSIMSIPALDKGAAFTVMVVWEVAVQPFEAVPVTVYVCVAFGVKATPLETPLFQV